MHAVLYVCLPRSQARSSLQARKKVCEYLTQEGFDTQLRFSGRCDYFKVGGRWSGRLTLMRLQHEQPKLMARFWKRYAAISTGDDAAALFRELFPKYEGKIPVGRNPYGHLNGYLDDAQIMDESLFQQLKAGFSEEVSYDHEVMEPNVIFTDDTDEGEWPKTAEAAAKFWVVVIDYHF